jgi:hypothetical protein
MSKQTAVEWLEQEFIALQNYGVHELGLFLKAKEMDKEQKIEAYRDGRTDQQSDRQSRFYNRSSEVWYNDTFNK